jgi:hypothetical protein
MRFCFLNSLSLFYFGPYSLSILTLSPHSHTLSPLSHSLSTLTLSLHSHALSPFSHSLSILTLSLHSHTLSPFSRSLLTLTLSLHSHTLSRFSHSLSILTLSLHSHTLSPCLFPLSLPILPSLSLPSHPPFTLSPFPSSLHSFSLLFPSTSPPVPSHFLTHPSSPHPLQSGTSEVPMVTPIPTTSTAAKGLQSARQDPWGYRK